MLYNETFYPVHANETFYSVQAPVYLTRQRSNVLAYLWHTWFSPKELATIIDLLHSKDNRTLPSFTNFPISNKRCGLDHVCVSRCVVLDVLEVLDVWLGGLVVRASAFRAEGPGFESQCHLV